MAAYQLNTAHTDLIQGLLSDLKMEFQGSYSRIAHCLAQLPEDEVWWRPYEEMNAIGNLILHLCGNLGQWVLAGVGGKPDVRRRAEEFSHREPLPKAFLLEKLQNILAEVYTVIERLNESRLLERRHIQSYHTTVLTALLHVVHHFEGHAQEIIYITRMRLGSKYQYQWEPKSP